MPWEIIPKMMKKSIEIFEEKKDYLDSINVFPVPDGDTGINMYLTLKEIVKRVNEIDKDDKEGITEAISQGAFIGAKGNSGTILSQFLRGWIHELNTSEHITPESFAKALEAGKKKAYRAMMDPKEGTMLTVFRFIADHAQKLHSVSWSTFIHEIFEVSQEATLKTREMMDVLQDGGVVDSGALGVVYVLQGWALTIEEHVSKVMVQEEIISGLEGLKSHIDLEEVETSTDNRYCTEALIKTSSPIDKLRQDFSERGSYFMLTSEGELAKLHIHTDKPHEIIRDFGKNGRLHFVKIDDMISQAHYFR